MSRKSRRRRDTSAIANRRLPPLSNLTRGLSPLLAIEDRRTWHPEGAQRPARSFNQSQHRLLVPAVPTRRPQSRPGRVGSGYPKLRSPSPVVAFGAPEKVLVCVRRKQREEVLHAKRKTGKSGQKRPRRSWYSRISCKKG